MPRKLVCCLLSCVLCASISLANNTPPYYSKMDDGVIVYPDVDLSGGAAAVRLQVISDDIIKVTASASKEITDIPSLIILPQKKFFSTMEVERRQR